jgi:hypothetical protein
VDSIKNLRELALFAGAGGGILGGQSNSEDEGALWRNGEHGADEEATGRRSDIGGGAEEDDGGEWWSSESGILRVVDGVANRVDMLKAIGNGQVPLVAATAFRRLKQILENN